MGSVVFTVRPSACAGSAVVSASVAAASVLAASVTAAVVFPYAGAADVSFLSPPLPVSPAMAATVPKSALNVFFLTYIPPG